MPTSSSPTNLHPLLYGSYERLKKHACDIDKRLLYSLQRLDNFTRLNFLMEVERKGKTQMQEGKKEDAYILYSRAMTIYLLISDSADDEFKRSRGGAHFYETSQRLCEDFDKVAVSLQQRFMDGQGEESEFCDPLGLSWAEIVEKPISENLDCNKDSNSSDDQDKIRSLSPANATELDKTDRGTGMIQHAMTNNLATVAQSGTSEFISKLFDSSISSKQNQDLATQSLHLNEEARNFLELNKLKKSEKMEKPVKVSKENKKGEEKSKEVNKEENEYTEFCNSTTKDIDESLVHVQFFAEFESSFKSIFYVPETLTADEFQNQNLAFSSGTMKNLREGKKIGSSETGKKNGLMRIWRFDKYSVKVAGQIIVESAKWLKTWIFIKIPDKILLDYHI
ncbi:hypothetical protein niasHT_016560 [Heterodera trifolii]|uniref:Uncharacterized protein n=1 Tax=Heterodera trifolii TaxID=157864 RepID=A0ABD2LK84_9BILA